MGSPQFFQLKPLRKSSSVQRENINKTRSLPSATICNSAHVSGNSLKILLCCFSMNFLTLHRPCTGESPRCWPERWRGDRMREGGGVHQQSLCFGFKSPGVFNCYYCPISCLMRDYFAPPLRCSWLPPYNSFYTFPSVSSSGIISDRSFSRRKEDTRQVQSCLPALLAK